MASICWLCCSVVGRAQKKDNGLYLPFCLGESYPLALALMPDTSAPPYIPLVPFKLLSQWCWSSEGVSLSKSMCGFFKGNSLGLQNFLPLTQSLLVFVGQKLWGLIFLALEPWAGVPGMGCLAPEISLPNFYPPHVDVGPAYFTSLSLIPIWMDVVSLILYLSDSI